MSYLALYRKYRPQNFSEVVGQEPIKLALSNALKQDKIVHAYLFAGPRGTGKTSLAKIFAKTLNCLNSADKITACNTCPNCLSITAGSNMDVFEIDAASNRGIDEIRNLRDNVKFSPTSCKYKVYIIDEVHMLTIEAFNALLKTLEEPPAHVIFILATTEVHKIPITIQSRCQRFDFRKLNTMDLEQRLNFVAQDSQISVTPEAVSLIALQADGALRDALSLLEQASIVETPVSAASLRTMLGSVHKEQLRELLLLIAEKNTASLLISLNKILNSGKDSRNLLYELIGYLRAILIFKIQPEDPTILLADATTEIASFQDLFSETQLTEIINALQILLQELKVSSKPLLTLELGFIKLCQHNAYYSELEQRVAVLEKRVAQVLAGQAPTMISVNLPTNNSPQIPTTPNIATTTPTSPNLNLDKNNLYQSLLTKLHKDNKRAVLACLNFAKVHDLVNNRLIVSISKDFACERLMQNDFLQIIRNTLQELTNQAIDFQALSENQLQSSATSQEETLTPIEPTELETLEPAVQKAIDMFGGQLNTINK